MREWHELVDLEPRVVASCQEPLNVDAGKASQVREASLGFKVTQA